MELLNSAHYLQKEAKAWLSHRDGSSEVIRVVPACAPLGQQCYVLYPAYDTTTENLGRILFDDKGFWIYDGEDLQVDEQEQMASFIINYVERI